MTLTTKVIALASLNFFTLTLALCQSPSNGRGSPKPKTDPCDATKEYAYNEGVKQGTDAGSKDAWGKGFSAAMELQQLIYSVKVGDAPKIQKISIVVEDIDGSTSYQFAAAEVIRTYFSDFLVVDPDSNLTLHIGGIKSMAVGYGDVQSLDVEVYTGANQTIVVGEDKRLLFGRLELASEGGTLRNYSPQDKSQAVREYIYKALSKYREKWEKAAPKSSQPSGGM